MNSSKAAARLDIKIVGQNKIRFSHGDSDLGVPLKAVRLPLLENLRNLYFREP